MLVPLGYVAAVVAAALIVVFATFGYPEHAFAAFLVAPIVAMVLAVGTTAFVPAAIAILVSEIFRLRSVFYFVLVGGAIGFAAHELGQLAGVIVIFDHRPVTYPAAGFVGGFVYWLIAGTSAGVAAPDPADGQ